MTKVVVSVEVNGRTQDALVEPRQTLADLLREEFQLTGTHLGCEHGVCGACTVLVDGVAVRSCLMLAVQAPGMRVTTIEGLERDGQLHPLQEAFRSADVPLSERRGDLVVDQRSGASTPSTRPPATGKSLRLPREQPIAWQLSSGRCRAGTPTGPTSPRRRRPEPRRALRQRCAGVEPWVPPSQAGVYCVLNDLPRRGEDLKAKGRIRKGRA